MIVLAGFDTQQTNSVCMDNVAIVTVTTTNYSEL